MDNINIGDGTKRISINEDPERVISFNPKDTLFVEKFYQLITDFDVKSKEFSTRADEISITTELDGNGIPANMNESFDLLKDICNYLREQVDFVFGKDTSQKVFGDALDLDVFQQFFEGIMPFIQSARTEKVARYTKNGRSRGATMK